MTRVSEEDLIKGDDSTFVLFSSWETGDEGSGTSYVDGENGRIVLRIASFLLDTMNGMYEKSSTFEKMVLLTSPWNDLTNELKRFIDHAEKTLTRE